MMFKVVKIRLFGTNKNEVLNNASTKKAAESKRFQQL